MPDIETSKPVIEKIPHVYSLTGKKLAEMCKFKGIVTSVTSEKFAYCDKTDNTEKTGYKITVHTLEKAEQA